MTARQYSQEVCRALLSLNGLRFAAHSPASPVLRRVAHPKHFYASDKLQLTPEIPFRLASHIGLALLWP